ncbi:methionine adenosyltransferase domain-containing protein, partial [Bacillus cereus]|nr:methionine adenosyltransferase domain-containing protein [Bacillus cereus]
IIFYFRVGVIIIMLELRRPIFTKSSYYGHFGRSDVDLSWERTD